MYVLKVMEEIKMEKKSALTKLLLIVNLMLGNEFFKNM